jgi:hypothetical protein
MKAYCRKLNAYASVGTGSVAGSIQSNPTKKKSIDGHGVTPPLSQEIQDTGNCEPTIHAASPACKTRLRFAHWLLHCMGGWVRGSMTLAWQPFWSVRFRSSMEPPWASAICRDSTRPIPLPEGLVV